MNYYDFDLFKLVEQYLPPILRKPKILAWLKSLFAPIQTLKTSILAYFTYARREIRMNGQVIVLENYLNDTFDSVLRRIKIFDNSGRYFIKSSVNVYSLASIDSVSKSKTLYIPSLTDFNFSVDFVVKTPFATSDRAFYKSSVNSYVFPNNINGFLESGSVESNISNTVKKYKIAGKSFQIDSI